MLWLYWTLKSFFFILTSPPFRQLPTSEESILGGTNSTAELIPPKESIPWKHDPGPYLKTDSRFGKKCKLTVNCDFFIEDSVIVRRNLIVWNLSCPFTWRWCALSSSWWWLCGRGLSPRARTRALIEYMTLSILKISQSWGTFTTSKLCLYQLTIVLSIMAPSPSNPSIEYET